MSYLLRDTVLFPRNEAGELLPVEIELDLPDKPTIKVLPITRGKFAEIYNEATKGNGLEQDNRILLEHCLEPKFTEEEIKRLKPAYSSSIVTAIVNMSVGRPADKKTEDWETKKKMTEAKEQ